PSSKPHGEDRSEPSTPSASPSRAAPCLAQLENVNGDLSNYKSLSADSGDNDADIRADYGIVTLLTKMNEDKTLVQGEKDYGLQIFDLTNDALAAYGYYLRRASIKNGQGKGK